MADLLSLDPGPSSPEEVLYWIETGRMAPEQAISLFSTFAQTGQNLSRRERGEGEKESADQVLEDLNGLVGLNPIKRVVGDIRAYVEVQSLRVEAGLKGHQQSFHMIFSGSPGTGKTTVARIMGRLFKALQVLPKGHLVEVERADLVGEYIGHTAQKTRDAVKRALGGVLFVDEAYALARGGEKDFGKEAIDTLVAASENHRNQLLVLEFRTPTTAGFFGGSKAANPC